MRHETNALYVYVCVCVCACVMHACLYLYVYSSSPIIFVFYWNANIMCMIYTRTVKNIRAKCKVTKRKLLTLYTR